MLPPAPGTGELIRSTRPAAPIRRLDVVFPVLHGPYGEDGTVQGLLELADVPYVGAGVLGSAVGMDKDVQKRLLQAAGSGRAASSRCTRATWRAAAATAMRTRAAALGLPLFVKPANLGSSRRHHARSRPRPRSPPRSQRRSSTTTKIVIEQGIDAREIECAVLGNDDARGLGARRDRARSESSTRTRRSTSTSTGRVCRFPHRSPPRRTATVRSLAVRAFQRARMRRHGAGRLLPRARHRASSYVNEINTIPGFTTISMYPKLWEASGLPYGAADRPPDRPGARTARASPPTAHDLATGDRTESPPRLRGAHAARQQGGAGFPPAPVLGVWRTVTRIAGGRNRADSGDRRPAVAAAGRSPRLDTEKVTADRSSGRQRCDGKTQNGCCTLPVPARTTGCCREPSPAPPPRSGEAAGDAGGHGRAADDRVVADVVDRDVEALHLTRVQVEDFGSTSIRVGALKISRIRVLIVGAPALHTPLPSWSCTAGSKTSTPSS